MDDLDILTQEDWVVFTTREFAHATGRSLSAATQWLRKLSERGHITHVHRGIWTNQHHRDFHPRLCVAPLLRSESGYVSLLSALFTHEVIEQIPTREQVVTTGNPKTLATPVGTFEFFHMAPRLHRRGIELSMTRTPYRLATAEKALFDAVYLSTRKAKRFSKLPELDTKRLRAHELAKLLEQLTLPGTIRTAIVKRVEETFGSSVNSL